MLALIDTARLQFLQLSLPATALFAAIIIYVYYVGMGVPIMLYWRRYPERKSSRTYPWKDLRVGLRACVIITASLTFSFWLIQQRLGEVKNIYASEPWWWQLRQLVVYILLHDAYFYIMHRTLHHPRFFKRFHSVHHQSLVPNPWSVFAFHPMEAFVTSIFLPVFILLIPISPLCFTVFLLMTAAFNSIGHNGFEFFSQRWLNSLVGRWLNNYTNHAHHHRWVTVSYGLYTSIWDRVCGTLDAVAAEKLARHTNIWKDESLTFPGGPSDVDAQEIPAPAKSNARA